MLHHLAMLPVAISLPTIPSKKQTNPRLYNFDVTPFFTTTFSLWFISKNPLHLFQTFFGFSPNSLAFWGLITLTLVFSMALLRGDVLMITCQGLGAYELFGHSLVMTSRGFDLGAGDPGSWIRLPKYWEGRFLQYWRVVIILLMGGMNLWTYQISNAFIKCNMSVDNSRVWHVMDACICHHHHRA